MHNYNGSTCCTHCCFRDKAFEDKQKTDPEASKFFEAKARDVQQAYNWGREFCVTLHHSAATKELARFRI